MVARNVGHHALPLPKRQETKRIKMCNCIAMTNEALKARGLQLATKIQFSMQNGSMSTILPVPVEKIDPKDRKTKLVTLTASYCPFCGENALPHSIGGEAGQ
jgi:hypothetical protein